MSKETVAKQFFTDFLENLGDNLDGEDERNTEEANFILTDLFSLDCWTSVGILKNTNQYSNIITNRNSTPHI